MRRKVRKSLALLLAIALAVSMMTGMALSASAGSDAASEGPPAAADETQAEQKTESGDKQDDTQKAEADQTDASKDKQDDTQKAEADQTDASKDKQEDAQKDDGAAASGKTEDAAKPDTAGAADEQTATVGSGKNALTVRTKAAKGVLPAGAKLVVKKLADADKQYKSAAKSLDDSKITYDDFLALDVGFEVDGQAVEPRGSVDVQFQLGSGLLPEVADAASLAVQHLTNGGKVETVADAGKKADGTVAVKDQKVNADFTVDSFSSFTITWLVAKTVTVYYVDETGKQIDADASNVTINDGQTLNIKKEYGHDISGYTYSCARYNNATRGTQVATIQRNGNSLYLKDDTGTTKQTIGLLTFNASIYLVYTKDTTGGQTGPQQGLNHETYVEDNGDGTYDLSLTVQGAKGSETNKAKLDILFILDASSSMAYGMSTRERTVSAPNRRIDKVASAATAFTTQLSNNNNLDVRYDVVTFQSTATVAQGWTSSAGAVNAAVANVTPNLGTNYQAAIAKGKQELNKARSDAQEIVIFLTDGAPTLKGTGVIPVGTGLLTLQDYIDAAKNELTGMTADDFYSVGVMLNSSVPVMQDNFRVVDKTGSAILKEVCGGATHITTVPDPYMGSDEATLTDAFTNIQTNVTRYLCSNVTVTDALSDNAQMLMDGSNPKKLAVTVKDENNNPIETPSGITASYDAANKKIVMDFPDSYRLDPDDTYTVTATIQPTEAAYQAYRDNHETYPNTGETGTGATSAGKLGLYSNKENGAAVTYTYNKTSKSEAYAKPVIQLNPGTLKIAKTFSGLTDAQIAALNDKLTFDVAYTYPGGSEQTKEVAFNTSTFTKGDDGVYTYTALTGVSPDTAYSVTESGATVQDYDLTATNADVSSTVPAGETKTASFTNDYASSKRTITLKQVVGGNMGERKRSFTFGVSDGATLDKTTLQDQGTTTITANWGTTVTITETAADGYTTTASGITDGTYDDSQHTYTFTMGKDMNADTVVTFTNTKQVIPPSGLPSNVAPYVAMMGTAAAAGIGYAVVRWRKHSDER